MDFVNCNLLNVLFFQCKAVRDYFIKNPQERRKMSEKSRASTLFKGKKSLYPKTSVFFLHTCLYWDDFGSNVVVVFFSVPIPFKSDHLNLKMDERWSKVVAQTNEQRIIWGDNVQKLNRKDAKVGQWVTGMCLLRYWESITAVTY